MSNEIIAMKYIAVLETENDHINVIAKQIRDLDNDIKKLKTIAQRSCLFSSAEHEILSKTFGINLQFADHFK